MLPDDVLDYVHRSVLCWLATVDSDGFPNVSPKEVFAVFDRQTMVIANIASPNTVRNLRANSRVCVSFIDVFVQKGYKVRGVAELISPDHPRFSEFSLPLLALTRGSFRILNIIVVDVSDVQPIVAPGYRLIAGTTEASQVESAMRTYGVISQVTPMRTALASKEF